MTEHDKFLKDWGRFFKKFDRIQDIFWHKARDVISAEWSRECPGQGLGSSDINHSIYGKFGHVKTLLQLKKAILIASRDENGIDISDDTIHSMAKDPEPWICMFAEE